MKEKRKKEWKIDILGCTKILKHFNGKRYNKTETNDRFYKYICSEEDKELIHY